MAIPFITGEGNSRSISVSIVNRLTIKPPEIYVERTHILSSEELVVRWKPSKFFRRIKVIVARDSNFTDIVSSITADDPSGTKIGKFPTGQIYVRASWDNASVQNVKG